MRLLILLFIIFFGLTSGISAQEKYINISGQVVDSHGNIAGASVYLKGTQIGELSNSEGHFSLKASEGAYTIVVQHLGYKTFEKHLEIKVGTDIFMGSIQLSETTKELDAVVVTGQFRPQSVKNSVYQIRTISNEQIRLRGATNIQSILNTELGMRFSNDLTLGTTDVQLMGMSGQNVKILLDGVPMLDRGSTRESLGQIDINIIDRIEIVEGPMSVIYGSDALAGVINIITKKLDNQSTWTLTARMQEETAAHEYHVLNGEGTHNESLGLAWQKNGFQLSGNFTRNFFGGWQGNNLNRKKEWLPKEQYLSTTSVAYSNEKFNAWYRFNGTTETLKSFGNTFISSQTNNLSATDQYYITHRWLHQLQTEYKLNTKHRIVTAASFTDYSRKTQTTDIDLINNRRTLNLNGSQDKSIFKTIFLRITSLHSFSSTISLQHGIESNFNTSSGERIYGQPNIHEFAYFGTTELKFGNSIHLRTGLRFLKNSVYNAPPVIPSLNAKFNLAKRLDLRLAYARGFRSPSLRELYFTFFDSSHSIRGNTDLKAEYSNSFNAFLSYQVIDKTLLRLHSTLGSFYNAFENLISIGTDPKDATISTYLNIDTYKTTGITLNNTFFAKELQGSLGFSRIGRYNRVSESLELPAFVWSSELNGTLIYIIPKTETSLSLFYKYTGRLPTYQAVSVENGVIANLAETAGFHMADITINRIFYKKYTLMAGAKNLFDVTKIANTSLTTTGGHATGGNLPMSYGRSYFIGITAQLSKN